MLYHSCLENELEREQDTAWKEHCCHWEPYGERKSLRAEPQWEDWHRERSAVPAVDVATDIFIHRGLSLNGGGIHCKSQGSGASLLGFLSRFLLPSPLPAEEIRNRMDLCHRHSDLFDEAGQVYVPFWKTSTLVGAQGDMDLVIHIKPLGVVVQLFSLQGNSCHEAKSPVEVFKMVLLEDGISAFHFIPPNSPQIWQQLVPLFSTQSVCLASLEEGEQRPQGIPFIGQECASDLWEKFSQCWLLWIQVPDSKQQTFRFPWKCPARRWGLHWSS